MSRLLYHSFRSRNSPFRPGSLNLSSPSLSLLTVSSSQLQKRSFFQGSLLWNEGRLASVFCPSGNDDNKHEGISLRAIDDPCYQQVRWKRNDGARFYMKPRPPTRKERKEYNRHKKMMEERANKHGKPGSKAGPLRALNRFATEQLFKPLPPLPTAAQAEEYNIGQALVDTLVETTDCADTPVPINIGKKERTYYNRVADQMEEFQRNVVQMKKQQRNGEGTGNGNAVAASSVQLPSDKDISLALRAFRDRHGTRLKPVGLAKALTLLLQDLGLPIAAFGELTFTALMSCCRTPTEARRVMTLMKQNDVEIGTYVWATLVDIHAKLGDYQGCVAVHDEMAAAGLAPVLASYTSLFSACHRFCTDGRNPIKDRIKASETAWEKWMEMFSIGIQPDVMAYGAILRMFAARGMAERCLNILDEMAMFEVKPTTLCFTTALKAVAKSHGIAIRYERGDSRRMMRREEITAHHGKLAQEILIKAESAGVEQDEGFVAALISCAGAAGDLATAKAIYTASQIRKLKQFRTAGLDDRTLEMAEQASANLALLSGTEGTALRSSDNMAFNQSKKRGTQKSELREFEEREYGKDSRALSALARACANAASRSQVGSMWQGRENDGYLCINSLRLLKTPGQPQYQDVTVPGEQRSDHWDEEKDRIFLQDDVKWGRKHGRRHKGVIASTEDVALTTEELSPTMKEIILNPDGSKKKEYAITTFDDAWKNKYGEYDPFYREVKEQQGYILPDIPVSAALPSSDQGETKSLAFSYDTMRWESVSPAMATLPARHASSSVGGSSSVGAAPVEKVEEQKGATAGNDQEKLFFNYDTMKWETRVASASDDSTYSSASTSGGSSFEKSNENVDESNSEVAKPFSDSENHTNDGSVNTSYLSGRGRGEGSDLKFNEKQQYENDFGLFFTELKKEIVDSGAEMGTVDEVEARELYASLKARHRQRSDAGAKIASSEAGVKTLEFSPFDIEQNKEMSEQNVDANEFLDNLDEDTIDNMSSQEIGEKLFGRSARDYEQDPLPPESKLEELRDILPLFSEQRLKRILRVFNTELGTPNLTELVLAVRERMPDYIDRAWLRKMSRLTGSYILNEAERNEVVDIYFLNSMLSLKTSLGFLDDALSFHQTEFEKRGIEPSQFSDRLVLNMFLRESRFNRAMKFKANLAAKSRVLDIKSYGALVDFCAKREQLGTALMILEECIKIHKGIPEENSLSKLRSLLNKAKMDDDPKIMEMIGQDPNHYLKLGIAQQLSRAGVGSKRRRHDVTKLHDAMRPG